MEVLQDQAPDDRVSYEGMGGMCVPEGVFFRVWAPHANAVCVSGSFNNWQEPGLTLNAEDNGMWAGLAANAKEGDEYKFVLETDGGQIKRNDPYALKVTNSSGNSVVYNHDTFDWQDTQFDIPTWQQLVIYELHVGTFNVVEREQVGTFYTAIERLPYLKEMGFNAIELMPCSEFPGSRSWGL